MTGWAADVLGTYVLPGGVADPRPVVEQARRAEAVGLGTAWIGERYDTKDLPSLAGALTQTTDRIRIGAAVTHTGLRHPMVLASMGQTLQALSGGRFLLGVGRSASWRWRNYGVPAPTLQSLGDTAAILRRLWAGETVAYDGPAGRFPRLRLAQRPEVSPPPLLLAAVGPRTLALAGRSFDGVILHPFLTPEAVGRSVGIVRAEARARPAGIPAPSVATPPWSWPRTARARRPHWRCGHAPRGTCTWRAWGTPWWRPTAGIPRTSPATGAIPASPGSAASRRTRR